jgi:hypothetical protein
MARLKRSSRARKTALEAYPFACCTICGMTEVSVLDVAHLDQDPSNDTPDNLAFLCKTHHTMFDCGLYPVEGIRLLRAHWQIWHAKGAQADHSIYMKDAGKKAGQTRRRKTAARKAVATRRAKAMKPKQG